jgi:hypothetical protein
LAQFNRNADGADGSIEDGRGRMAGGLRLMVTSQLLL